MESRYSLPALELVEEVFTEHENAEEGNTVRRLVEEIRSKKYYLPELELIMVNEDDDIIVYGVQIAGFHLVYKTVCLLKNAPGRERFAVQPTKRNTSSALFSTIFQKTMN